MAGVGEAAALASAFLWSLTNILMGSQAGKISGPVISAFRNVAGAVALLLLSAGVLLAGYGGAPALGAAVGLAISGAIGIGAGDTFYIGSLRRIGVSRAFPISMAVYPLLTLALAVTLLGEDVTPRVVAGAVLIIIGVSLIVTGGHTAVAEHDRRLVRRDLWTGIAFVVAGSALWAVASVWLRSASEDVHPVIAQAIRTPAAAVVTVALVRVAGFPLDPRCYSRRSLEALAYTALLGTVLGSVLFVIAVQEAGAARTAVLSSSAPLFALPMAALFLKERVTARIALGTMLSIAGIWLVI